MSVRVRILSMLALCGLLLNILLLYWKLADPAAGVAGCGGGGCGEVLASRWSQVFGLPVSALGIFLYLLLFAALLRDWRETCAACFIAILGAAIWFIVVQAVILRHFCPWCMVAHGVGTFTAVAGLASSSGVRSCRNGMVAGAAAAYALALSQVYGPVPASHRIEENNSTRPGASRDQGPGRGISFHDGGRTFDITALPRLGSADARHVVVEYFDYRCPACRTMRGYLDALIRKYPADVAVLVLPVPLERSCNDALRPVDQNHPGSCDLARIALAVWRVKPEAFAGIHQALMSDSSLDQKAALGLAGRQASAMELASAMKDPWIDQILQADIDDWVSISKGTRQLPKLLIRDKRILHGVPPSEEEFIRVMEAELGF